MLQEDNIRLAESLHARKDQLQGSVVTAEKIKLKDNLIEELTNKLKESTKVI